MKHMPKIGYKQVDKPIKFIEYNSGEGSLKQLQKLVGGFIEVAGHIGEMDVICDEEGRITGKPYNCMGIYGDIVFIGVQGAEFRGLTEAEIKRLSGYDILNIGGAYDGD